MHEIQSYIVEAMRVRRAIQVYSEFFDSEESIKALYHNSADVANVLRRSMHDEIIISLSRLFDSDKYKNYEYLSQRNLTEKHISAMNPSLINLREKTEELRKKISIKDYRDFNLAHNDKSSLVGDVEKIKHKVSFNDVVELVETSIRLMLGLMVSISGKESVDVWANLNDKYTDKGTAFINRLRV